MALMEWTNPDILWLLLTLPLLAVLLFYQFRKKKKAVSEIWRENLEAGRLFRYRGVQGLLILVGIAFIIIALANPRKGDQPVSQEVESAEIILAVDISRSMLATDIQPDRLTIAKNVCLELIKELRLERIGSIVFAGNAYVNMPLTQDISALPTFIQNISVESAGTQGTAIGEAIELAYGPFSADDPAGKQLIILSDGEDHEENVIDQAEQAAKSGMTIHTVGIGTLSGSRIPVKERGRTQFVRDKNNEEVVSRLKEKLLRDIASATGGRYFKYESIYQLSNELATHIKNTAERTVSTTQYRSYVYYYKYALLIALIMFSGAIWIQWRKI